MNVKIPLISLATSAVLSFAAVSSLSAQTFTDDFNRTNAAFNSNASIPVGAGYFLGNTSGATSATDTPRLPQVRLLDNDLDFSADTNTGSTNPNNITLRYEGLELLNGSVGQSFSLSGDVLSFNSANQALTYGIVFNYQTSGASAGDFYAARLQTGNSTGLQFIRYDASANTLQSFANVNTVSNLATITNYRIGISSSAAGAFSYTLTDLDGSNSINGGNSIAGSATDNVLQLADGFGGFYISGVSLVPQFDNLSISVVPEPATAGLLLGMGILAFVGVRRRRA